MTGEKQIQPAVETTLHEGLVVGEKYRVERLIGKGGMAAVWAGTNERTGKKVALKVILRSFASSPDAAELFRREALAAGRVNHPNVVNVFDVIDHEGMTCLVMELLDGEPFGTYLSRKGYLSVEETVALLLPAMRGVAAANAEGVVHRDLKPQNIFLCIGQDGRLITTKVLDFGISVMMERALDSSSATRLVTTHGTPAYMSPEHIQGAPDIDARADVYGFGVLFFEALTGQIPFLGEPGPALLMRILNEPAPKVTVFRPDLPAHVVEIVERAMAKDPRDRFPTMEHFIRAIEDYLLPPSPLPRSLTPMVGVPVFTMTESSSGVADPVVQVVYRNEASGAHEINETKALYTLARDTEGGSGDVARANGQVLRTLEVPPPGTVELGLRPAVQRDLRRFLSKRVVTGAIFVAVLALVVWIAIPNPGGRRDARKASDVPVPTSQTSARQVTLPTDKTAAPPTTTPTLPPEPVAAPAAHGLGETPSHALPLIKPVPARPTRAQGEEKRARANSSSGTHTGTRTGTQSSGPRAGTLSPDDF